MQSLKRIYPCPSCKECSKVVRAGSYYRSCDRRQIARFLCRGCKRHFSAACFSSRAWQKKRDINGPLSRLLSSSTSMRRSALLLGINRKTVSRRLPFLAAQAKARQEKFLARFKARPAKNVQFDDLETFEHSKYRPISIAMAVEAKTRVILGFSISDMPAKGTVARFSRRKYGRRADLRHQGWNSLFLDLKNRVAEDAKFLSDQNPHYPPFVKKHFPKAKHRTIKGARGSIRGQGELKRVPFDPLFSLNHTFAMLRANISRLIRKTWCTTKKLSQLAHHIQIYVDFHNRVLLRKSLSRDPVHTHS